MRKDFQGFAHVAILVIVLIVAVAGLAGWRVMSAGKSKETKDTSSTVSVTTSGEESSEELLWQQVDGGWAPMPSVDVPDCPDQPIMKMPADILLVTSVLYPGQTRGGNYKPHGGFRFDNSKNSDISVTAPVGGFIVRGGHYIAEGEIQYTFDIFNNCGVMYRVGHLRVLPEDLQKLTTSWPEANASSGTNEIRPAVYVETGHKLATSVGIVEDDNTFFDWGVYDYRKKNKASEDSSFQAAHQQDRDLSWNAVCWFDWLSASDEAKIRSLPAGDPNSAKNSDYCD